MKIPVQVFGQVPAVWLAVAAGAAVLLLMNSKSVTRGLVNAGANTLAEAAKGAALGAADVATNYGAPGYAIKAGNALANTTWANTARGWVGLSDLNSPEAKAICQAARAAGDDVTALKFCPPASFWDGLLDGR